MKEFYAHGKLLISGEYLILDGAKGLALPTKKGQKLEVTSQNDQLIQWESFDHNNELWFSMSCTTDFEKTETTDPEISKHLITLLSEAKRQNPKFLGSGASVKTHLEFPREWGLGSSSTLISTIAQWAAIDPFLLLKDRFKGSGYDIACATAKGPIIYNIENQKPRIVECSFNPNFIDHLFFVYLGSKQISSEAINSYQKLHFDKQSAIQKISSLTDQLTNADDLISFQKLLSEHESLMASILNTKPVKEQFFLDYQGAVKSLGAWGGDFVLMCGTKKTPSYVLEKGFDIVIPFRDMIFY